MTAPSALLAAFSTVTALSWVGCGPGQRQPRHARRRAAAASSAANPRVGSPPPMRPGSDIQISGLRGTIDGAAVERAFRKKHREVAACRRKHMGSLSYVGGEMTFFFEVGTDGVPTKVLLERSQLGHWQMESCILRVARGLRFVKPEGGKAEVRYTMTLANDGTDAKDWDASRARPTLKRRRRALRACRKGGKPRRFTLTFYVLPGGAVKTVGVVSPEPLPPGFAACVARVVTALTFPDPLGSVARATYSF